MSVIDRVKTHFESLQTITIEVDEWKDCNNLSYITHKEMAKSLDKTTKR